MSVILGAAAVGGGLALAGGLAGNRAAAKESRKQRKLTKYLAENQHQIATRDLESAGLNRILAATQGGNTSGNFSAASQSNPAEGIPGAVSSAAQSQLAETQNKALKQSIKIKKPLETEAKSTDKLLDTKGGTALTWLKVLRENLTGGRRASAKLNPATN